MERDSFVDISPAVRRLQAALEEAQYAGVEQGALQEAMQLLERSSPVLVTVRRLSGDPIQVSARTVDDLRESVAERLGAEPRWLSFSSNGSLLQPGMSLSQEVFVVISDPQMNPTATPVGPCVPGYSREEMAVLKGPVSKDLHATGKRRQRERMYSLALAEDLRSWGRKLRGGHHLVA